MPNYYDLRSKVAKVCLGETDGENEMYSKDKWNEVLGVRDYPILNPCCCGKMVRYKISYNTCSTCSIEICFMRPEF